MNSIECDTIVTNRLTIGDANSESFIVMDSDSKSRRSSIKISGKNTIIISSDKDKSQILLKSANSSIELSISDGTPCIKINNKGEEWFWSSAD